MIEWSTVERVVGAADLCCVPSTFRVSVTPAGHLTPGGRLVEPRCRVGRLVCVATPSSSDSSSTCRPLAPVSSLAGVADGTAAFVRPQGAVHHRSDQCWSGDRFAGGTCGTSGAQSPNVDALAGFGSLEGATTALKHPTHILRLAVRLAVARHGALLHWSSSSPSGWRTTATEKVDDTGADRAACVRPACTSSRATCARLSAAELAARLSAAAEAANSAVG